MTFNYGTLKKAEREGTRLGNWNGKAVFAASANNLENLGSGAYYILYDEENRIVTRVGIAWKSVGEVSEAGFVHECTPQAFSARSYKTSAEAAAAARKASSAAWPQTSGMRYSSEPIPQATMKVCGYTADAAEGSYAPGYDVSERPVGDVKTEIDVEKTLNMAREMSIEDLLDGFLPGLSYDIVAKG